MRPVRFLSNNPKAHNQVAFGEALEENSLVEKGLYVFPILRKEHFLNEAISVCPIHPHASYK